MRTSCVLCNNYRYRTFLAEFPVLSNEFGEGEVDTTEVLLLWVEAADRLTTDGLGAGDPEIHHHYII